MYLDRKLGHPILISHLLRCAVLLPGPNPACGRTKSPPPPRAASRAPPPPSPVHSTALRLPFACTTTVFSQVHGFAHHRLPASPSLLSQRSALEGEGLIRYKQRCLDTADLLYYCDYCDTYLTHDSPSVRKQHNAGYKHKANVRIYYQQFEEQQTQSLIDQRIKEHLGQAAAYQQVGVAYNSLMGQRPSLPILPPPRLPIPGNAPVLGTQPLFPGMRPVLPRPGPVALGYFSAPGMPPTVPPSGAPSVPGQANTLPRPPTLAPPPMVPGNPATPASNGAPSMVSSAMYQANSSAPSTGGYDSYNANAQVPEGNH